MPAGIFYYRMQDPMLEADGERTPEEINGEILKKLKLCGLVNGDQEIIKSMDRELDYSRKKTSDVIPVSCTKDGFSRYSATADRKHFEELSRFVNGKMKEIGKRILAGETAAHPYERKNRTACDYCEFREVCGFDRKIPGTDYHRLREYKPEDIWTKMEEVNGRDGSSKMDGGTEAGH